MCVHVYPHKHTYTNTYAHASVWFTRGTKFYFPGTENWIKRPKLFCAKYLCKELFKTTIRESLAFQYSLRNRQNPFTSNEWVKIVYIPRDVEIKVCIVPG
jgi:hypothetical protein